MKESLLALGLLVAPLAPSQYTIINTPPIEVPINNPARVEDEILFVAQKYDVSGKKALEIARAESELKVHVKNPSATSTASGVYQFVDGTFKWLCVDRYKIASDMTQKNDPKIQIECAIRTRADGDDFHWNASRARWGKMI